MALTTAAPTGTDQRTHPSRLLLDSTGKLLREPTRQDVEAALAGGQFFWLNLPADDGEDETWLKEVFGFHPLAIDDAITFGERPKFEEYDDHVLMVMYGSAAPEIPEDAEDTEGSDQLADDIDDVLEIHCFVSEKYMVTVDKGRCEAFRRLAERLAARGVKVADPARLFHRVADILVDSFFPVLARLDDRIDEIEQELIDRPRTTQMADLLQFRRAMVNLRRIITPQRDMFASLSGGVVELPGMDDEAQRYYRDVYDHLIRLSDLIDGYRDLLSGATDAYLSVTSNQLNVVMKQLAIISTVFLPLSFLTGFFGQNFGFLVNHITSWEWFVFAGVGLDLSVVVGMFFLFKSRGWLGK